MVRDGWRRMAGEGWLARNDGKALDYGSRDCRLDPTAAFSLPNLCPSRLV